MKIGGKIEEGKITVPQWSIFTAVFLFLYRLLTHGNKKGLKDRKNKKKKHAFRFAYF